MVLRQFIIKNFYVLSRSNVPPVSDETVVRGPVSGESKQPTNSVCTWPQFKAYTKFKIGNVVCYGVSSPSLFFQP